VRDGDGGGGEGAGADGFGQDRKGGRENLVLILDGAGESWDERVQGLGARGQNRDLGGL